MALSLFGGEAVISGQPRRAWPYWEWCSMSGQGWVGEVALSQQKPSSIAAVEGTPCTVGFQKQQGLFYKF